VSIEYWEKRYQQTSSDDASWPDVGARFLELDFIERNVPVDPGSVLEVGCGSLSIAASPLLRAWIAGTSYAGIDGSPVAIALASVRAHELGLNVQLNVQDFEAHRELRRADFLLCRRLLCNLSREARRELMNQFVKFPHGLMIEPTKDGLKELNAARAHRNLPPIPEAEHNDYLDEDEIRHFKSGRFNHATALNGARQVNDQHCIRETRFMSPYYERTRAKEELGKIDQQWRYEQARLAKFEAPGLLGPVVGFAW